VKAVVKKARNSKQALADFLMTISYKMHGGSFILACLFEISFQEEHFWDARRCIDDSKQISIFLLVGRFLSL